MNASKFEISDDVYRKIESVLGFDISSRKGDSESFLEFSSDDERDFRSLGEIGGVYAIGYIRHRLKFYVSLNLVVSYYSTVIQQGGSVFDWMDETKS